MFFVRPVEIADIPALEALAADATPWVHTFPKTREKITQVVERSIASFIAKVNEPGEEAYVFVLESATDRAILGAATIFAIAGSNGTYFAFRNDVLHQVSRELNISHKLHALTLCSELTEHSQLSSFYLSNLQPAGPEAILLSRARLLFAAIAPHRFRDRFFVSLAGITNEKAESPFWDAIGRKFFQMDFLDAERAVEGARNRTLIIELMPHHPVFVPLLPDDAQVVLGETHSECQLQLRWLTEEGFSPDQYVDIFDGGPILQAHKHGLRSFSESFFRVVLDASTTPVKTTPQAKHRYLISNRSESTFRAVLFEAPELESDSIVGLPPDTMRILQLVVGDSVVCVRL